MEHWDYMVCTTLPAQNRPAGPAGSGGRTQTRACTRQKKARAPGCYWYGPCRKTDTWKGLASFITFTTACTSGVRCADPATGSGILPICCSSEKRFIPLLCTTNRKRRQRDMLQNCWVSRTSTCSVCVTGEQQHHELPGGCQHSRKSESSAECEGNRILSVSRKGRFWCQRR